MALKTFNAGSPFNFGTQAIWYIPELPDPRKEADSWRAKSLLETRFLIEAFDGRMLSLYTSKTELREAYEALQPFVEETLGHNLYQQATGSNNRELARLFAQEEHSVLLGLKSFGTGVDVQGSSLSVLNANKLPFAVPTDVMFKARCDAWDRQHRSKPFDNNGSFWKIAIPEMTLTLSQWLGRGVRTVFDHCVLTTMDPRLLTTGYGRKIVRGVTEVEMPGLKVVKTRAEVLAFRDAHLPVAA